MYFDEFRDFDTNQILYFCVGLFVTILGVAILSARGSGVKKTPRQRIIGATLAIIFTHRLRKRLRRTRKENGQGDDDNDENTLGVKVPRSPTKRMNAPSPVRKNLFPVGIIGLPGIAARSLFGAMPGFRGKRRSRNRVVPSSTNRSPEPGPPPISTKRMMSTPLYSKRPSPLGTTPLRRTLISQTGPPASFKKQQQNEINNMLARSASSQLMENMLQRKAADQVMRSSKYRFNQKRDLVKRVASNEAIRERLSQALSSTKKNIRDFSSASAKKRLTRYQKSWSDQADDLLRTLKSPEGPEYDEGDHEEKDEEERKARRRRRRRRRKNRGHHNRRR